MYPCQITGKVVVISDTHGDYEPTKAMLTYLSKEKIIDDRWVVFIGDYVDEGPDTNNLIALLLAFNNYHTNTTFLCGNHDLNLAKALNIIPSPYENFYWNRIPARNHTVLKSYNVSNGTELLNRMPQDHKDFLANLVWLVEHPDYLFVHVGIDPRDNFDEQLKDLRSMDQTIFKPKWLYKNSLGIVGNSEQTNKTIITGHMNMHGKPRAFDNRIMIDTGAGYGGKLTALLLPEKQFLQV